MSKENTIYSVFDDYGLIRYVCGKAVAFTHCTKSDLDTTKFPWSCYIRGKVMCLTRDLTEKQAINYIAENAYG